MKYRITEATNFIRIFEVPDEFPPEFCFGGGHNTIFILTDWFNPFEQKLFWEEKELVYVESSLAYQERIIKLRNFVKGKQYFKPDKTFMALTDYGDVFLINPELRARKLQKQMDEINAKMKE